MAVKGKFITILNLSLFLSRLYGGKDKCKSIQLNINFLSRLYGGKESQNYPLFLLLFLSRLYGGKDILSHTGDVLMVSKPPVWR